MPAGITFVADRLGNAAGAIALGGSSYFSTGLGAVPALPAANAPHTVSALAKCATTASSLPQNVFMYGTAATGTARTGLAGVTAAGGQTSMPATPSIVGYAGIATLSADGPGTNSAFLYPVGLNADLYGNVYIGESWANNIRRIRNGVTSTLTRTGCCVFSATGAFATTTGAAACGDGGPASQAQTCNAQGVGSDDFGNVFIADLTNRYGVHRVARAPLAKHVTLTFLLATPATFPPTAASA